MSRHSGTLGNGDTADSSPSVDSEDQQERIQARRLRIEARRDAKRREALGEDPNAQTQQREEPRNSHKQIEDSRQRLTKLVSDGSQLVTNIQVAADARETKRRAEEEELRRQRVEKLNNEAKTSLEKCDEISKKWVTTKAKEIHQDLWDLLNTQQQQCAQLIGDKNKLISELQQDLKRKDDQYVKDLKKQAEDIDLLIERMEEQIRNLIKTYREELLQTEKSFELERRELLNTNSKNWEQGMQERRDKELENLMNRMKKVEEYEQQLNHLRVQDGEEYNSLKIKLETEVQTLQQQLQQMKARYQLNQETLEYNFQVLKKRDEENAILKAQQKRKITRLQDVLNNLKLKLEKQIKQSKDENQSLADDFRRIVDQYKEVQKKMRHFSAIDSKKFHDIWLMNEEEMKELVHRVLEADRVIQEQQLGLPWKDPELWFMDNVGPIVPQHKKKKTASMLAQEMLTSAGEHRSLTSPSHPFSAHAVKQILELLCDESGFLIESKLVKLLSPLEKDERSLMKLDSIFTALGIEDEDDVYKLVGFFCKYKQGLTDQDEETNAHDHTSDGSTENNCPPATPTSDLIHPNDVLHALKAFAMDFRRQREKLAHSKLSALEERDSSEDSAYWAAFAHVIPESRLKVWDALESALAKYHDVLTNRSQLIAETGSLRQQNTELRMLLQQYLNSRINTELEIPPTRILQVDFS
ncbi:dynein regulatory complex protein 1 [Bombina bombina]|uniref:dynein regulatory complex protein 1 n=1 Tax=Bombina bombina TaxID=8345 RepID=UPI00235AA397|nr:dynein regulatory complex protein 1 [Bombina bombina]